MGGVQWKVTAGLVLAATIAWFAPFDLAFGAATLGLPVLRTAGIVALALIGSVAGRQIGLELEIMDVKRPLLTPLGIAAVVGLACAVTDWLLHAALPGRFIVLMTTTPLLTRTIVYVMRAFNENIIYRLFLGSVLIWLIGRIWKAADGGPAIGACWTGFTVAQLVNVWINSTALVPLTPLTVVHDVLRYIAPGMVWSWLYWKRGFQSCEIACTSVHIFYQPLVTMGLI